MFCVIYQGLILNKPSNRVNWIYYPTVLTSYSSAVNLPDGLTFPFKRFSTTLTDDNGMDS